MRYVSLFAGIEAATVAWHPLGWTPVAFSEIDPFPRAVLAHHYPDVPLLGDMTAVDWSQYRGHADLVVGGSPCQAFSVAGLRKGLDDPRGNLTLEFLRAVDRIRPAWVVWENVPGVLSIDGGRVFGAFLGGLGQLGYGFAYRVLDAQYFGVPQRRRRVFVVGCAGDWRHAAAVLFERHSLSGHPAPRRKTGQGVAASLAPSLSASGRGTARAGESRGQDCLIASTGDVSHCLNAGGMGRQDYETETLVAFTSKDHGADAGELAVAFDTTQITSAANRSNPRPGDPCHPLAAGAHAPAVAFHNRQDPDVSGDVTHPLGAQDNGMGVQSGMAVRRLTPRECERLQGLPDDYTLVPYRGRPASDGPRYKALGNSMAVPCMRWIGERIALVDSLAATLTTTEAA